MKETVLICSNMSNVITDKTNVMFEVLVLFSLNMLWTLFVFNITCYVFSFSSSLQFLRT